MKNILKLRWSYKILYKQRLPYIHNYIDIINYQFIIRYTNTCNAITNNTYKKLNTPKKKLQTINII